MTLTLRRTLAVLSVGLLAADPASAQRGGRPGGGGPPGGGRGGPPSGGGGRSMPPPAARPAPSSGQRAAAPVPRSLPPQAGPAVPRGGFGPPGPGGDFRRGAFYPPAAGGLPGPITDVGGRPRPGGLPATNPALVGRPGGFPGNSGYGFPRYGYGGSPFGFGGFPGYGFGYPGYGYGGSGFGLGFGVGTAVGLLGSSALGGFGGVPFGGFGFGYPGFGAGWGGGLAVPPAYRPVFPLAATAGGYDLPPTLPAAAIDVAPAPQAVSPALESLATSAGADYAGRAVALVAAGRYDEAVTAFQHAAVDNPRDGRLALQAARALAAAGRYDEAAGAAQQGLAGLPPERWLAAIRDSALEVPTAVDAAAIAGAVRAAADKPGAGPGPKFLAGVLAAGRGDAARAVADLQAAAGAAPQDQVAKRLAELVAVPR